MTGEDGQMILLSALVACLCLIGVVACVEAAGYGPKDDGGYLSADSFKNALWAQDAALKDAALHDSGQDWDRRADCVRQFKEDAGSSLDGLSGGLLKYGVAYRFSFNDTLAGEYVSGHAGDGSENIGGVLVKRSGVSATVFGCAYDASADDGTTRYTMSRVSVFE